MTNPPFSIVIPARLESSRLAGKVLLDIAGKPMLQHVWERSLESNAADVTIATDSEEVAAVARAFGAQVCMTAASCQSGTDRVAEVAASLNWDGSRIIVNVQGDAPMIPPASINRVASLLQEHAQSEMATLAVPLKQAADYADSNVVKVVADKAGRALYFSRAAIPAAGHGQTSADAARQAWRHLGLYAYRVSALQTLCATEPCELEKMERLEQLRAMWLGMEIRIALDLEDHGPDVDTEADLRAVERALAEGASG